MALPGYTSCLNFCCPALPEALSVAFQGAAAPRGDKRRSRSGYKRHLSDDDDGH